MLAVDVFETAACFVALPQSRRCWEMVLRSICRALFIFLLDQPFSKRLKSASVCTIFNLFAMVNGGTFSSAHCKWNYKTEDNRLIRSLL